MEHDGILIGDAAGALGAVTAVDDLLRERGAELIVTVDASSPLARWLTTERVLSVGHDPCTVWPEDGVDQQTVRLGVLDFAGNFSGWLSTEVTLPTSEEAAAFDTARGAAADACHREKLAQVTQSRDGGAFDGHVACALGSARPYCAAARLPLALAAAALAGLATLRRKAARP